jgi:hypothetical protein
METFSTTDAALAGFRLVREHPRTVAVWGVILLIVSAITNVLMIVSGGSDMHFLKRWPPSTADVAQMQGEMQALAPVSLLCMLLSMVAFAIIFTGVYRVLLRPADRGLAHLRLGRDEVRQFLALLVWALTMLAAYLAAVIVGGLIVAVVQIATGGQGPLFALVLLTATAGIFAFMIYTAVRISFIGVLTFMTGKIDLKGALALTKGRFWRLFGTYVLAFVLFVIVNLVVMMLATMLGLIAGGLAGASQVLQPDVSSLSLLLTPTGAVTLLAACAMSVLGILVLFAPVPEIYRQLTADKIDLTTPSWPVLNHDAEG